MNNFNHTPGPWVAEDFGSLNEQDDIEILDTDGFPICTVEATPILHGWPEKTGLTHWAHDTDRTQKERPDSEVEANARMIEATPDMAKALEGCLNVLIACVKPRDEVDDPQFIAEAKQMAVDALNKARGYDD